MSAWQLTLAVTGLLTTLSASAWGNLPLIELIAQVEKNEALYRNLETIVDSHYVTAPDKEMLSDTETMDTKHRLHFIRQGERYRVDQSEESVLIDGSASASSTIRAFDGSQVVTRQKDGSVTVSDTPKLANFSPHQMWVRGVAFVPPLSVWLSGDDAVTKFTGWDHHVRGYRNEIQSLGTDDVDGLTCHKVRRDRIDLKSGKPALAELLWVAEDRNYLPIRVYHYRYSWSLDVPIAQTSVEEFRELSPGVWSPARMTHTKYGPLDSKGLAERQWQWRATMTIASVSTAPDFPVEHFSEKQVRSAPQPSPAKGAAQDPSKEPPQDATREQPR